MSALLQALAAGDFAALAARLQRAGLTTYLPAPAMLQLDSPVPTAMRLLISVGVHGNETAPIEMLAQIFASLADAPHSLAVNLLVVVGNPAAIALGRRFIDADLNRLFRHKRSNQAAAAEANRAELIMRASANFFATGAGQGDHKKWHLDLHTAIRPSRYPRFAIIPASADDPAQNELSAWLGSAGIDAVVFNDEPASTYSAFSAHALGSISTTVELGQVGTLGNNALAPLERTRAALARLLRGQPEPAGGILPVRFRVAQEIVKRAEDFQMTIGKDTHNFTALAPGALIGTDAMQTLRVGARLEYVVFPNPDVLVGQRAGLMVVEADKVG